MNDEALKSQAVFEAEQFGIVFIDELDKIGSSKMRHRSSDASDEGVQRDLLPIIEGTKVKTKDYGDVDTSKILFIGAGAFLHVKPSDLLAELQGRLPVRVKLDSLNKEDFYRILT